MIMWHPSQFTSIFFRVLNASWYWRSLQTSSIPLSRYSWLDRWLLFANNQHPSFEFRLDHSWRFQFGISSTSLPNSNENSFDRYFQVSCMIKVKIYAVGMLISVEIFAWINPASLMLYTGHLCVDQAYFLILYLNPCIIQAYFFLLLCHGCLLNSTVILLID